MRTAIVDAIGWSVAVTGEALKILPTGLFIGFAAAAFYEYLN